MLPRPIIAILVPEASVMPLPRKATPSRKLFLYHLHYLLFCFFFCFCPEPCGMLSLELGFPARAEDNVCGWKNRKKELMPAANST
jgi:hypothetical protein